MFIMNRDYLNDEYVAMTRNYLIQYTQQAILEFRDTLIQHLESVKKLVDESVQLKREYDSWVNERQMQTTEEKVDTSKAFDASSVDTKCSRTESKELDTSSKSRNDAHDDGADIRPIYDEEPMAEVQTTAKIDVFAIGQQYTEQPEFNNEGEIPEHSYQSLESENSCLKKAVAQFQKDFSRLEAHCVNLELKYQNQVLNKGRQSQFLKVKSNEAKVKHDIDVIETINIELKHKVTKLLKVYKTLKKNYKELFDSIKITKAKTIEYTTSLIATNDKFKAQLQEKGFAIAALKNELRKSTGNSVNTKFAKSSILRKPISQSHRNQSVVRQPTAFKFERPRISKPRCDSQVDVNYNLSKPVTTHYLPKEREDASAKPHHMIASKNFRISSKNMTRFSSNDMVHNHYLEEAKKKTQEYNRNSEPSLMHSARSNSTANGSKPRPRRNTQTYRIWPASKNSFVTTRTVPIAKNFRNSRNFSDSKHFVCSTCQKCIYTANHDSCVTKFLKEVNSRAKVPSNKTTNKNKPVEQINIPNKQERQIPIGHRFSIQKTYIVQKKTMTLRSCLRWKSTGKIFKTVGLRWVPTGRIFTSSTTKGFKEFSSDVQAMNSNHNSSELEIHDHSNEPSSSKLVPNVVPPACKTATSRQELELLFHHHLTMLRSTFLRYDGDECDKGRMPTKIELTLEQSQQVVGNEFLVSIKGVEELKRNVWIKGENKAALTLKVETGSIHMISVFTKVNSGIEDKTSWTQ
nr:actin-binding, cofilin/tropomyosin type [Tanacetum cinerariifolium]